MLCPTAPLQLPTLACLWPLGEAFEASSITSVFSNWAVVKYSCLKDGAAWLLLEGQQRAGWDIPAPARGQGHPADEKDDQQDSAVQPDRRELQALCQRPEIRRAQEPAGVAPPAPARL